MFVVSALPAFRLLDFHFLLSLNSFMLVCSESPRALCTPRGRPFTSLESSCTTVLVCACALAAVDAQSGQHPVHQGCLCTDDLPVHSVHCGWLFTVLLRRADPQNHRSACCWLLASTPSPPFGWPVRPGNSHKAICKVGERSSAKALQLVARCTLSFLSTSFLREQCSPWPCPPSGRCSCSAPISFRWVSPS